MNRPLRANDVEVEVIRRARCKIPTCDGWIGGEHKLYPGANADREAHMAWHRNGEPALADGPAAASPAELHREILSFLSEALDGDDMSLDEIVSEIVDLTHQPAVQ